MAEASVETLPNEIIHHIASLLLPVHLTRLCRVSRFFHQIAHPLLYEHVSIHIDRTGHVSQPNAYSAPLFARSLLENTELRSKVRHLSIQTSRTYPWHASSEMPLVDFVPVLKTWSLADLPQADLRLLQLTRLPLSEELDHGAQVHQRPRCIHLARRDSEFMSLVSLRRSHGFWEVEHHIMALILSLLPGLETLALGIQLNNRFQNYIGCLLDGLILDGVIEQRPLQNLKSLSIHVADDRSIHPPGLLELPPPFICAGLITLPSLQSLRIEHDKGVWLGPIRTSEGLITRPLRITSLTLAGTFSTPTSLPPLLNNTPFLTSLSITKNPSFRHEEHDTRPEEVPETLNQLLPKLSSTLTSLRLLASPLDSVALFRVQDERLTTLPQLGLLTHLEISLSALFKSSLDWAAEADLPSLLPPNLETLAIHDDWFPRWSRSSQLRLGPPMGEVIPLAKTLESGERGTRLLSLVCGLKDDRKKKMPKLWEIKMIKAEALVAFAGLEELLISEFEGTGVKVEVDWDVEGGTYHLLVNCKAWDGDTSFEDNGSGAGVWGEGGA
ncbi:hypothetical protein QBC44DRAFT_382760 [Cladorrhinum sp. PSN332]|nr:hypothetical protein QBC44DRAFT_382760 [Cladorrhinum sp. PSN332]